MADYGDHRLLTLPPLELVNLWDLPIFSMRAWIEICRDYPFDMANLYSSCGLLTMEQVVRRLFYINFYVHVQLFIFNTGIVEIKQFDILWKWLTNINPDNVCKINSFRLNYCICAIHKISIILVLA